MSEQARESAERHGHRARADGDVGRLDADEIHEKRHGQDRAAAADQAQDGPYKGAGDQR